MTRVSIPAAALAMLRIITALLFVQHGVQKLFGWPPSQHFPASVGPLSLFGFAGLLELFGGLLILVGWFTRPVAFILAGEMAVAYWLFHFASAIDRPAGWMPAVNGGDSAIQFCFCFLYLAAVGAGRWSFDQRRAPVVDTARDFGA